MSEPKRTGRRRVEAVEEDLVQQFAAGVAMGQGMPQSSKQNMQLMTPYVSASAPSNSSLQQPHFGSTDTSE